MDGNAFDNVRINSSLPEQFNTLDLLSFFLEYIDEQSANCLSFCFRVSLPGQLIIEPFPRIDALHIQSKFFVSGQYCFKFVFAQYSIVNKNSVKVTSNCTTDECCCYRGI